MSEKTNEIAERKSEIVKAMTMTDVEFYPAVDNNLSLHLRTQSLPLST